MTALKPPFPDGHFYSPTIDVQDIAARKASIWPPVPHVRGIDFNEQFHQHFLREVFPQFIADYDYPERLDESGDLRQFYTQNSQFSWLDSRVLFVMLRYLRPARLIEVGSGFSSLLIADVNQRFLSGAMAVRCIEPYPRDFLKRGIPGISELVQKRVQDIPIREFESLAAGDVLFIDSSHVAKTGSDVNYLIFDVLPALKPGVRVHVHDVFLPYDYLQDWVLKEGRSWNEQYVLRALLMYSTAFRFMFGCNFAFERFPGLVRDALALSSGAAFGGGSVWIECLPHD